MMFLENTFVPIPRTVPMLSTAGALWAGALLLIGYLIGDNKALVKHLMPYIATLFIAGAAAAIVFYIRRHRKKNGVAAHDNVQ